MSDLECRVCNPEPVNTAWYTQARVNELLAEKDAEIKALKRDVAGQTRSAQNGWRTAETFREQRRRILLLIATAATMSHSNGYPVQAVPKADLLAAMEAK